VRYNPDKYKTGDEQRRSEHEVHRKRMEVLIDVVNKYLASPPKEFLTVTYLFYDGWTGEHQLSTILKFEGDRRKRRPKIIIKRRVVN
jgi:hypothetical protein